MRPRYIQASCMLDTKGSCRYNSCILRKLLEVENRKIYIWYRNDFAEIFKDLVKVLNRNLQYDFKLYEHWEKRFC